MPEQEQDEERSAIVDRRSSSGGKHDDATEALRREAKEAGKKAHEAVLSAQLEEEKKKAETYLANWQRAAADFQNYKRRTEQEREEIGRLAHAALVLNILPILDDMERALTSDDAHLAGLTWVDGIWLIYRKLQ